MPGWIFVLILMLICGLSGLMIGFVLGAESPQEDRERRRKDEQR